MSHLIFLQIQEVFLLLHPDKLIILINIIKTMFRNLKIILKYFTGKFCIVCCIIHTRNIIIQKTMGMEFTNRNTNPNVWYWLFRHLP